MSTRSVSTHSVSTSVSKSILAIENELASELSLDAVVDTFASEDKNRRILLK